MKSRIQTIRESERLSHTKIYTDEELYHTDSWLSKPIKTVREIMELFSGYEFFRALDLGCGVGRNSIYVAECFKGKECLVDCVDLLDIAIEKLNDNAKAHGVSERINGIAGTIEDFEIAKDEYDFIMAVSALEHVESEERFLCALGSIRDGVRENGVVCMVINSEVSECDSVTKEPLEAQFEVNLSADKVLAYVDEVFRGWKVIKRTVSRQEYDVPRETAVSRLSTKVVTCVAKRE
ncbi:MAG: class I SAM-dependent methyltransferase [Lachnospiraceae bacterium]|nr:class I SAM-dependent methyltransferase [Lachnospiraceae bacterium]